MYVLFEKIITLIRSTFYLGNIINKATRINKLVCLSVYTSKLNRLFWKISLRRYFHVMMQFAHQPIANTEIKSSDKKSKWRGKKQHKNSPNITPREHRMRTIVRKSFLRYNHKPTSQIHKHFRI